MVFHIDVLIWMKNLLDVLKFHTFKMSPKITLLIVLPLSYIIFFVWNVIIFMSIWGKELTSG